ncbi:hypothetical protein T265_04344 [Opisthorchis viverrini]|uniref:Uncharacterized protein n=1 Tax=Opisthorchis viverrini TaxID=6198 RepID=A0A074ZT07_OPIVI|nr:hypothetical protein T265_04344 [Opisthorchis viverrini]KER28967.1 hypothetical protein T265_04344 [Opisthorchis viverrini]
MVTRPVSHFPDHEPSTPTLGYPPVPPQTSIAPKKFTPVLLNAESFQPLSGATIEDGNRVSRFRPPDLMTLRPFPPKRALGLKHLLSKPGIVTPLPKASRNCTRKTGFTQTWLISEPVCIGKRANQLPLEAYTQLLAFSPLTQHANRQILKKHPSSRIHPIACLLSPDATCEQANPEKASILSGSIASEICQPLECHHQVSIYSFSDPILLELTKTALLMACSTPNTICTVR